MLFYRANLLANGDRCFYEGFTKMSKAALSAHLLSSDFMQASAKYMGLLEEMYPYVDTRVLDVIAQTRDPIVSVSVPFRPTSQSPVVLKPTTGDLITRMYRARQEASAKAAKGLNL